MIPASLTQNNSVLSEAANLVETWIAQINKPAESRPFVGQSLSASCHGNPITEDPFGYLYDTIEHDTVNCPNNATGTLHNAQSTYPPTLLPLSAEQRVDYDHGENYDMTRFDWCDGEVGENVKHVLTGLLRTEVSVSNNRDCMPWIDNDPVVTMEARHKRVKERRALKDHAHKTALTEQKRKIEIQRRAKEMIKKEEQERRKRERHEEELIRTHVAAIKRQMRQQKERERSVQAHLHKMEEEEVIKKEANRLKKQEIQLILDSPVTDTKYERESVLLQNKMEVIQAKRKHKILCNIFRTWYNLVQTQFGLMKKAVLVGEWKLLLRSWKRWQRIVKTRRTRRWMMEAADQLREEKRKIGIGSDHYCGRVLRRCVSSWRALTLSNRLHKKMDAHYANIKDKVVEYLTELKTDSNQERNVIVSQEEKEVADQSGGPLLPRVGGVNKGVWSQARNHVDALLSMSVSRSDHRDTSVNSSATRELTYLSLAKRITACNSQKDGGKLVTMTICRPPLKKLSTKPIEPRGMKERSILIADRRQAREERKKRKEKEREVELASIEERKKMEERMNKEAEIKRKREEKQITMEREREKQKRLKHLLKLTNEADNHYKIHLMKKYLYPWIKFTHLMEHASLVAVRRHAVVLTDAVWKVWFEEYRKRIGHKNSIADGFHRNTLLIQSIKQWKQFMALERELLRYCREKSDSFLLRKCFISWEKVVRLERIQHWEKERRARKHHERKICQICMHAWIEFVPLSHEEKQREVRRAELRRKVCLWLPDYKPSDEFM